MDWELQDAKARFSEVIKKAESEGPQHITVRGTLAAVVLSEPEYARLVDAGDSLVDFMRRSPLYGEEQIDLSGNQSLGREIEF